MRFSRSAALLLVLPAAASAQSMNAEQFHQRATALQKKGLMAMFSGSEIKTLTAEAQAAGKRAGENRKAAIRAGEPARFCPPEQAISMGDKEFMSRLSAIPAGDRERIDMTEAMTRMLAVKYPCKR